jgi:hypothetical protein
VPAQKKVKYSSLCFYWCETWTLILREKYQLRFFEKQVLRKIFGTKKYGETKEEPVN